MLEFESGKIVPGTRYRVISAIGAGGMGSVYEVEHVELGKRFVLKALFRDLAGRKDLVARLRQEWRALGRLDHPNIINVTDAGTTATGVPFYVMERVDGETLADRLRRTHRIPVAEAVAIATSVLEAVAAAHEIGVVHRDIKPPNIFLGAAGVKLLDFGIAKLVDDKAEVITARGMAVGTPRYMSPEQARGEAVDGRADLYAVGLVLYEMLAGRGPFDDAADAPAMLLAHLTQAPPRLAEVAAGVVPELDDVVQSLLRKDPAARPATARQVAGVLAGIGRRWRAVSTNAPTPQAHYDAVTAEQRAPVAATPTAPGPRVQRDSAPPAQRDSAPRISAPEIATAVDGAAGRHRLGRAHTMPLSDYAARVQVTQTLDVGGDTELAPGAAVDPTVADSIGVEPTQENGVGRDSVPAGGSGFDPTLAAAPPSLGATDPGAPPSSVLRADAVGVTDVDARSPVSAAPGVEPVLAAVSAPASRRSGDGFEQTLRLDDVVATPGDAIETRTSVPVGNALGAEPPTPPPTTADAPVAAPASRRTGVWLVLAAAAAVVMVVIVALSLRAVLTRGAAPVAAAPNTGPATATVPAAPAAAPVPPSAAAAPASTAAGAPINSAGAENAAEDPPKNAAISPTKAAAPAARSAAASSPKPVPAADEPASAATAPAPAPPAPAPAPKPARPLLPSSGL